MTRENLENKPIYQQLVDEITRKIRSGRLPAGTRLPTVREWAAEKGIARGTVKHAYDTLAGLGLVGKTQGKGTFVLADTSLAPAGGGELPASKKAQAMVVIEQALDRLEALSFSLRDIRIIVELKLREREEAYRNVRIGAIDCSPEALAVISGQLAALPYVDVFEYLLQPILDSPRSFDPGLDMYITTPTHYRELKEKLAPGASLLQMVLAIAPDTILELARLAPQAKVGIWSASPRFAEIIRRACATYCALAAPPEIAFFGAQGGQEWAETRDILILPPEYTKFCSPEERDALAERERVGQALIYRYAIEKGSLLYLEEQVAKLQDMIQATG